MSEQRKDLSVSVLGAAGYAGGELLRLLLGHPEVGTIRGFSASHQGRPFADAHPALAHVRPGSFSPPDPAVAARDADVVFLALPHGESQDIMDQVLAADPGLVVDLAADFRVQDQSLYEAAYGPHRRPDLCADFVYGLADVEGSSLAGCRRIAAPGCFATAALLSLYPFMGAGGFREAPVAFAATGSSGSGASLRRTTHHPVRAHNFFAYSLSGHRHEAEILDRLRAFTGDGAATASLLTHSAPFVRGIHLTLFARPASPHPEPGVLLESTYAGRPFVRVLDRPPELSAITGTNFAHLHAAARNGGQEVIVTAAIDNLQKGAAGQAIQAMNLSLGLAETAGLEFPGIYPC